MINLLPKDDIKAIKIARVNRLLMHFCIITGIASFLFIGTVLSTLPTLDSLRKEATDAINDNEISNSRFADEQKEIKAFKENLSLSKDLISQRVTYSLALIRIGNHIPSGVIIGELNLSNALFDGDKYLEVKAVSVEKVLELKTNLEESPYFSDVRLESVDRKLKNDEREQSRTDNLPAPNPGQERGNGFSEEANSKYTVTAKIITKISKEIYNEEDKKESE